METGKADAPLDGQLAGELIQFWEGIFKEPMAEFRGVLDGSESEANRNTIYWAREGGRLIGACYLTTSVALPVLGGLGGVGVSPEFRRRGIASGMCRSARDDFRRRGGRAAFLATGSPDAARVYERLGWRRLTGAHIMANLTQQHSPEEFLSSYFRAAGPASVTEATAADRIPVIPLVASPHPWPLLDANAAMLSTRYAVQGSCMGLFPRYEELVRDGRGACFAARDRDGRTLGMATARLTESQEACVDGFTHPDHDGAWPDLIGRATRWAAQRGARTLFSHASADDGGKRHALRSLGFREAGSPTELELVGNRINCVRMERATGD